MLKGDLEGTYVRGDRGEISKSKG